jgi:hypothetical protein
MQTLRKMRCRSETARAFASFEVYDATRDNARNISGRKRAVLAPITGNATCHAIATESKPQENCE